MDSKNKKFTIKFRKNPSFFKLFSFHDITKDKSNNIPQIVQSLKIGGFRVGNFLTSIWFGAMLFAMQSYFLRQNLKLTDVKFISD